MLDEHLTSRNHIAIIENRVSKILATSLQNKQSAKHEFIKILYFSFTHSYNNSYRSFVWANVNRAKLKKKKKKKKNASIQKKKK